MVDYLDTARKLRRKAADPVVPEPERKALLERAAKLEAKYGNRNSPFTNDTTTTSRDGRGNFDFTIRYSSGSHAGKSTFAEAFWAAYLKDLADKQWQWNSEYTNPDGTPKPQKSAYTGPDQDDLYEESYKYDEDEDEDYGYDLYEGEDY